MTRINISTSLLACLLAAIAYTPTNAKPITTREQGWGGEGSESFKLLATEGTKFLQELANNPDDSPHASRSDDESKKSNDKAAIIGGTIASGAILGLAIFLAVLIYKRYIAPKRLERSKEQAKPSALHQRDSVPQTAGGKQYRTTWRNTFNHRVSISDTESEGSERLSRVSGFPLGQRFAMRGNESGPLGILPDTYLDPAIAASPYAPKPLRTVPRAPEPLLPASPVTPTHPPRESTSPMSTLTMKLFQDTKQPPQSAKYYLFPKCPPAEPHTIRVTQPPPPVMNNSPKKPGRMSSRRYFIPLFRSNGQLPSPTSPESSTISMSTFTRDESRANKYSMGDNRI